MAEEQQPIRRRFSWSYLFSFLIIAGIIITVIVLLFNRNGATTFDQAEFLSQLGQNNITEVRETPKEGTLVNLTGTYKYTNVFLKIAIACSFVYLLLDVLHYFWDSCSYYKHTQNIVKCESKDYIQKVYIPNREYIAKRSFVIFCLKALAFLLVSAMFLWGMFLAPLSHSSGLDTKNQTVQQFTHQSIIDNSIENDSTERR